MSEFSERAQGERFEGNTKIKKHLRTMIENGACNEELAEQMIAFLESHPEITCDKTRPDAWIQAGVEAGAFSQAKYFAIMDTLTAEYIAPAKEKKRLTPEQETWKRAWSDALDAFSDEHPDLSGEIENLRSAYYNLGAPEKTNFTAWMLEAMSAGDIPPEKRGQYTDLLANINDRAHYAS